MVPTVMKISASARLHKYVSDATLDSEMWYVPHPDTSSGTLAKRNHVLL